MQKNMENKKVFWGVFLNFFELCRFFANLPLLSRVVLIFGISTVSAGFLCFFGTLMLNSGVDIL